MTDHDEEIDEERIMRYREYLDADYFDAAIESDDDELTQRIVAAAKSKGIDPSKHGVLVPVLREDSWAKTTESYQEGKAALAQYEEASRKLRIARRRTRQAGEAGLSAVAAFVLLGIAEVSLAAMIIGAIGAYCITSIFNE